MLNASAVSYGPHDVRIEDRPVPNPAAGEVLVEIAAVGICGSDVHFFEHGRIGNDLVRDPMVIGHESAGTIVQVGEGVDRARIGQLVALEATESALTVGRTDRNSLKAIVRTAQLVDQPSSAQLSTTGATSA